MTKTSPTEVAAKPRRKSTKELAAKGVSSAMRSSVKEALDASGIECDKMKMSISKSPVDGSNSLIVVFTGLSEGADWDSFADNLRESTEDLEFVVPPSSKSKGNLILRVVNEEEAKVNAPKTVAELAARARRTGDRYDDMDADFADQSKIILGLVKKIKAAGIPVLKVTLGDFDTDTDIDLWRKGVDTYSIQISTDAKPTFYFNMTHAGKGDNFFVKHLGENRSIDKLLPVIKKQRASKVAPAPSKKAKTDAPGTNSKLTADFKKMVAKLAEKTGMGVSLQDYYEWMGDALDGATMDGTGSEKRFDKAVTKLIGKKARDAGEDYARLDNLVWYALGLGPDKIGGISMKAILENTGIKTTPVGSKDKDEATRAKAPIEIFGAVTLKGKEYQDDAMASLIGQNLTGIKYAGDLSDDEADHVVKVGNDKKDFIGKPFVSTTAMLKYVKSLMKAGHPMAKSPKPVKALPNTKSSDKPTAPAKPLSPKQKEQLRSVNTAIKKLKSQKGVAQYIKLAKMQARLKAKLG